MTRLGAHSRPSRTVLFFLLLSVAAAGLELFGIGASLSYLLR